MLRDEIWKQLADAERLMRYYYCLSQRYDRQERLVRGIILSIYILGVPTLLGASSPISDNPTLESWASWILLGLGLILAAATVWDMTMRYGEKAALLRVICSRCDKLLDQWRELWTEIEDEVVENDALWMKYRYLRDEQTASTQWSVLFGIKQDKDIHDKAEQEAHAYVEGSY